MIILQGTIVYDDLKNEYEVIKKIDNGGFSDIYKIKKIDTNELYVLKTFSSGFENQYELNSFINEINNAKDIDNENVIQYIFFNDGNIYTKLPPYIIMEYANGGNLDSYIEEKKKNEEYFSNSELLNIYTQLINGMKAINEKVVHRDIKPKNILLKDNKFKISDFGIAKFQNEKTREYNTFKGYGSLEYVSPEGWKNEKNTIQMDIYSMGIVFYNLATLQYPYELDLKLDKGERYKRAHLFETIINPLNINKNLNPVYATLISKMLEKSINKRFNNWNDILQIITTQNNEDKIDNDIINKMLEIRLNKDEEIKKKEIEETEEELKIQEDNELVEYSFMDNIYNPIKDCLDRFNQKYPSGEIKIVKQHVTRQISN